MQIRMLPILLGSILVLSGVSGCRPSAQTPGGNSAAQVTPVASDGTAPIESDAAPQAATKPLPGIKDERPAPDDTPGLDKAETAQAAKPDGVKENLDLAFAYYKAGAFAQAAPAFERVTQLAPKDPKAYLFLGYSQMAAGALQSAIDTFEKTTKLPDVSREVQSEAYLQRGYALGALGQKDQARESFSLSLGNNTRQGMASLALGSFAAERGQTAQAPDFFQDATQGLEPGPNQAQAFAALGYLAEKQNDKKTAIAQYKKALTIDEDNTWANEGWIRLGQSEKSKPKPVVIPDNKNGA